MTLNDLEPPKEGLFDKVFRNFWRQLQQWIATKWLGIDQDNLRAKFSALNADFSSPDPDPLSSKRPAQAGVKYSYPLKSGYFTAIGSFSVKQFADSHRYTAYHNKH